MFLIVLLVSLTFASFFGHAIHWLIHQRWTGPVYRAHMDHHLKQYPPSDLLSKTYRHAKWYNSGPLLFTPPLVMIMLAAMAVLWFFGMPLWALTTFAVTMICFGFVNDYVHDNSHIEGHWLERFAWFRNLRATHFQHHHNMKRNFGIVLFVWDKLFKTYIKR